MREGENPARTGQSAYTPQQLGIALLVYIPHLEGYFAEALEILKIQIASLHARTPVPFDLLVFDNGSCEEVRAALTGWQAGGWIDWLQLSRHNLGKTGALNWIFAALPNPLVCYADSDVLFRAGWYEKSRRILDAFPAAGIVSAQPCFFDILRGEGTAHLSEAARAYPRRDYRPPREIVHEYCQGIGAPPDVVQRYRDATLTMLQSEDASAVLGATHMQFLARREVIAAVLPLPVSQGLSPAEDRELDMRVDRAGYLHLSTANAYVYHIGNRIDDITRAEAAGLPSIDSARPAALKRSWSPLKRRMVRASAGLLKVPFFRKLFLRVYNAMFNLYSYKD
jgi:GT2 family glycosyltransferase